MCAQWLWHTRTQCACSGALRPTSQVYYDVEDAWMRGQVVNVQQGVLSVQYDDGSLDQFNATQQITMRLEQ